MDKSWMHCSKMAKEHEDGVEIFMRFAIANAEGSSVIRCPCTKCMNLSFVHIRLFTNICIFMILMFLTQPGVGMGKMSMTHHFLM
ncbi:hypothetical protein AB3S75_042343 [Citrus x aurantiifolia]